MLSVFEAATSSAVPIRVMIDAPVGDVAGRQPQPAQEGDDHQAGDARLGEADHVVEPGQR